MIFVAVSMLPVCHGFLSTQSAPALALRGSGKLVSPRFAPPVAARYHLECEALSILCRLSFIYDHVKTNLASSKRTLIQKRVLEDGLISTAGLPSAIRCVQVYPRELLALFR